MIYHIEVKVDKMMEWRWSSSSLKPKTDLLVVAAAVILLLVLLPRILVLPVLLLIALEAVDRKSFILLKKFL